MKKLYLGIIAALLLTQSTAYAGGFDKGYEAYLAEDYETAIVEFTELAEQGYASTQYNLSIMYYIGDGVVQNYATAHMWANVSTANGQPDAQNLRDQIASKMTQADIATAQKMASQCLASEYADCGY